MNHEASFVADPACEPEFQEIGVSEAQVDHVGGQAPGGAVRLFQKQSIRQDSQQVCKGSMSGAQIHVQNLAICRQVSGTWEAV